MLNYATVMKSTLLDLPEEDIEDWNSYVRYRCGNSNEDRLQSKTAIYSAIIISIGRKFEISRIFDALYYKGDLNRYHQTLLRLFNFDPLNNLIQNSFSYNL